jgi:hypothetical protein
MGGYGSGRWMFHTRKETVEECLILDMNRIANFVKFNCHDEFLKSGILQWSNAGTGEVTSRISYQVSTLENENPWIRLFYTRTRTKDEVDYKVQLTTTKQNFGGVRWWFVCPLVINNKSCLKRVGKLYLPSGSRYFGCRHCYDLTYTSSLESRKFDGLYAKLAADMPGMTPEAIKRLMRR